MQERQRFFAFHKILSELLMTRVREFSVNVL